MTPEQLKNIKDFSRAWITKVIAKKKDYRERLLLVLDDIFPEPGEHDGFDIINCRDWDRGEKYINPNNAKDISYNSSLGDRMTELIKNEGYSVCSFTLTKKAKNDFICTIRIACDLFIEQSAGVLGYTIGDLKKAFDGNIPEEILKTFEGDISQAGDNEPVWL